MRKEVSDTLHSETEVQTALKRQEVCQYATG